MPRVDTEGLEFAVALRVASGTEATEPPLWLHTLSGPVPITQSWGDGVFYQGRELEHYRGPAVPDSQPKVMFLHYLAARDQARFY